MNETETDFFAPGTRVRMRGETETFAAVALTLSDGSVILYTDKGQRWNCETRILREAS